MCASYIVAFLYGRGNGLAKGYISHGKQIAIAGFNSNLSVSLPH